MFAAMALAALCAFAEGEVRDLKQFEHWDNGNIRLCTVYDVNGYMKAKGFCRYDGTVEKIERYDMYGNKIEEALFDQRGKLKTGIDGWAAMRWWYDGYTLVSQISYDESGRPLDRRQYSQSGRLIFRHYRDDADFNPYEEANMAMMLGAANMAYYDNTMRREDVAY